MLLIKKSGFVGSSWNTRYCVLNPDTGVLTQYSGTSASGASKEVIVEHADTPTRAAHGGQEAVPPRLRAA